jgi:hypothetical protein
MLLGFTETGLGVGELPPPPPPPLQATPAIANTASMPGIITERMEITSHSL